MSENMERGTYLAQSKIIQRLNVPAIEGIRRLYERGLASGVFRSGLDPIDIHASISALTFFNVSNQHTFSLIFKRDTQAQQMCIRDRLSCAMDVANHRRATITGPAGTIETEYLNHTSDGPGHPWGYLPSELRVRRGTANSIPFEPVYSATGSGFRFGAEAFAQLVATGDTAAVARAAQASIDIAATLEAIAQSAREGRVIALR